MRNWECRCCFNLRMTWGVVSQICHSVKVMYLGQIVEEAKTDRLFAEPLHPYTKGLLASIPHLGVEKGEKLPTIPGTVLLFRKFRKDATSAHDVRKRRNSAEASSHHLWKYSRDIL